MKIFWLEQTEGDLPMGAPSAAREIGLATEGYATKPSREWLSARELHQLEGLRFPKRRADWQLGRWTAKHAVSACLGLPLDFATLARIDVRAAGSGEPQIFIGNKWAPVTISLSHREGRAVCSVSPSRGALGCDLEVVEPHSDAFIDDFFASEEQAVVAQAAPEDRDWLVTLIWSAKESALKALHAGLRLDTRCVIVTPADELPGPAVVAEHPAREGSARGPTAAVRAPDLVNDWHPLRVRHVNVQTLLGWWQRDDQHVRTLVAAPPPARPLLLKVTRPTTRSTDAVPAAQARAA
jgi:4'-phosphopantetheinyl transferase